MNEIDKYFIAFGGLILLMVAYVLWATYTTKDDE